MSINGTDQSSSDATSAPFQTVPPETPEHRACRSQPVAVTMLHPSPTNPRKTFAGERFDQMVESVRTHGVMQPLLLRVWPANQPISADYPHGFPSYEIVAGERRYRAARAAGIEIVPGLVRDLTDRQVVELQMVENLQREDLDELEEAEGYQLMVSNYGFTADELAARIGKSKAYIYARMKLTALCDKARDMLRAGKLSASTALLIARIPSSALQFQAAQEIGSRHYPMSHREASDWIQRRYMTDLKDAPFPRNDGTLVPDAGACNYCPKRTGNAPDLFVDIKAADVCTDPDCYRAKKVAWINVQRKEVEAKGIKVISEDDLEKIAPYGTDGGLRGYTKLDDRNYDAPPDEGGNRPTFRQQLGDTPLEIVAIPDERSGKLVEVVKTSQLTNALAEAGIKPAGSKDAANEKKRQAEQAYSRALYNAVRAQIDCELDADPNPHLDHALLLMVTRAHWERLWSEHQKLIAARWIDESDATNAHSRVTALSNGLSALTSAQLLMLQIDMATVGHLMISTFTDPKTAPALLELAERWHVDAEALRKTMAAEARVQARKTKPGSAKRVPAPTTAAQAEGTTAPETPAAPTPAAPTFSAGDRVVINLAKCAAHGSEAEVIGLAGFNLVEVRVGTAGEAKTYLLLPSDLLPAPAAEPAAQARKKTAPAKPAARAAKPKAEGNEQAAAAAKETRKSKKVGRASPAEENENTPTDAEADTEAPVARCDKTIDAFSGVAACEEGAAA